MTWRAGFCIVCERRVPPPYSYVCVECVAKEGRRKRVGLSMEEVILAALYLTEDGKIVVESAAQAQEVATLYGGAVEPIGNGRFAVIQKASDGGRGGVTG